MKDQGGAYVQCGEHLPLLFAVYQAVVVLHGDERRQVVRDRVVCAGASCPLGLSNAFRRVRLRTLHDVDCRCQCVLQVSSTPKPYVMWDDYSHSQA